MVNILSFRCLTPESRPNEKDYMIHLDSGVKRRNDRVPFVGVLALVLLLSACGGHRCQMMPFSHSYVCGEEGGRQHFLRANFRGNVARVDLDGVLSTLRFVAPERGAFDSAYDVRDRAERLTFTSDVPRKITFHKIGTGARAVLEFDGNSFDCVQQRR